MGNPISKFAFHPPDPADAERVLKSRFSRNHRIITNAKGNPVSMVHFSGRRMASSQRGADAPSKLIIFSHGNAEDLSNASYYELIAQQVGVDVLAYDYTGYGLSTSQRLHQIAQGNETPVEEAGCFSSAAQQEKRPEPTEEDCFACADAVYHHARSTLNVEEQNIVIVGRSVGSGPATHLATKHQGVRALVLLSPLKSCANVAGSVTGFLLTPIDLMCNESKLRKLSDTPVLIIHGTEDKVIPFEHARTLAKVLRKKAVNRSTFLIPVQGADHNDVEAVFGQQQFTTVLRDFIANPTTPPAQALTGED